MTVDSTFIPRISPFSVGDSADMTEADFTFYKNTAKVLYLDIDNPGMDTVTYDYCHALLICHLFASKPGNLEAKSYSVGKKYSISKDKGETSWLVQYHETIARFKTHIVNASLPTDGFVRTDSTMTDLELDRIDIPTFSDQEEIL